MPFYQQRGSLPGKRHIQHHSANGDLCYEEHVSREGFSDIYSNIYHLKPPTRVAKVGAFTPLVIEASPDKTHRHHHYESFRFAAGGNWVSGRKYLAFNSDVFMATARPLDGADFFYRNGEADEVIFVHYGSGTLHSPFGALQFGPGDYLVIPKGVLCQMEFSGDDTRLLVFESTGIIRTPRRYRNEHGQLLEHAPFSERDIRTPQFSGPHDQAGDFEIRLRINGGIQTYHMPHHPFDLVGWDGYYFPWAFNIRDFMPIVGKVHQPPPVHQNFESPGFVICSFVPRLFDFHEQAIPAPYAHSNVESDEVIYYVEGDFMSRKGVSQGSITLHPTGLPHGPQPGKYEGSIGAKQTEEFAVMLDTFRPLTRTRLSDEIDDANYPYSWLE
jgi:homogentisate 1,2-dioxygenase